MRLRLLAEYGRYITQPQRAFAFGEKRGRGARNQRRNVRSDRQHASVCVTESKSMMRLRASHAMLEKRIVINRGSRDLFVRPAIENRYHDAFDRPPQSRLRAGVITHSRWNPGKWFRHNQ